MPKKILIVDDEFLIRKVLSFLMEEQGYEVSVAKDGAECFDVLKDFTPRSHFPGYYDAKNRRQRDL